MTIKKVERNHKGESCKISAAFKNEFYYTTTTPLSYLSFSTYNKKKYKRVLFRKNYMVIHFRNFVDDC